MQLSPTQNQDLETRLPVGLLPAFLYHHRLCPVGIDDDGALAVAASEESLMTGVPLLAKAYGRTVTIVPLTAGEIEVRIERLAVASTIPIDVLPGLNADHGDLETDVRELAMHPPVIRYVNLLLQEALAAGASDVHLATVDHGRLSIQFRVDGVLVAPATPPPPRPDAVISRLKLLADLDISERRRPQDGRIRVRGPARSVDLRVACLPTLHGESVVLRILDRDGRPDTLDAIGLEGESLSRLRRMTRLRQGLVLITGPTGSGKTTTLYAALREREDSTNRVVTVEDPVEYRLDGVTQVPAHAEHGVTISDALRAVLRQDPDVIMVGEMRDRETAELAVQAALTGHLVLSTLHTTDAIGAIPRLLDLGVPPYLVAATLEGVVAQRLVRKVCAICRGIVTDCVAGSQACAACAGRGFKGRVGLFEVLVLSDSLRERIVEGVTRAALLQVAQREGFMTLDHDASTKVRLGITSESEVGRVLRG